MPWARTLYLSTKPSVRTVEYVCDAHKGYLADASMEDGWFRATPEEQIYYVDRQEERCPHCILFCYRSQWDVMSEVLVRATQKPVLYVGNGSEVIVRVQPRRSRYRILQEYHESRIVRLLSRTRAVHCARSEWYTGTPTHVVKPVWWNMSGAIFLSDDIRAIRRSVKRVCCDVCGQCCRFLHTSRKDNFCHVCDDYIRTAYRAIRRLQTFPVTLLDQWARAALRQDRRELLRAQYVLDHVEDLWQPMTTTK